MSFTRLAFAVWGVLAICGALAAAPPARAMETITFLRDGTTQTVRGEVRLEDSAGSVILRTPEDRLWLLMAREIVQRSREDTPFALLSDDEYAQTVLATLQPGFSVHRTNRYMVFHDTSRPYAVWCAGLFERLYLAFTNYWSHRGFKLQAPERPLTAIVFARRDDYLRFSRPVLGDAADVVVAYYNIHTNQLVMYDLTGREAAGVAGSRYNADEINRILASRNAVGTVATLIHEATHQIAFNCGLHERLSDAPLWLVEGVAMYFETPDLTSSRGWNAIDLVNRDRLTRMRRYMGGRPSDSLVTLITTDKRFRDTATALDAYAEAWALTYFLLHRYPRQYTAYVRLVSQKKPGVMDTPEQRWKDFTETIGVDPARLDQEFIRYTQQLR